MQDSELINKLEEVLSELKERQVNAPTNPVYYTVGECFLIDGSYYILSSIDFNKIVCINLKNGNRWTEPLEVENFADIKENDMSILMDEENHSREIWKKVSKGEAFKAILEDLKNSK
jgi:hypothetical protein